DRLVIRVYDAEAFLAHLVETWLRSRNEPDFCEELDHQWRADRWDLKYRRAPQEPLVARDDKGGPVITGEGEDLPIGFALGGRQSARSEKLQVTFVAEPQSGRCFPDAQMALLLESQNGRFSPARCGSLDRVCRRLFRHFYSDLQQFRHEEFSCFPHPATWQTRRPSICVHRRSSAAPPPTDGPCGP